jgi:CheY-like chemotaxis protein
VAVGECGDGPTAVKEVLELAPDLVILDVQMPGMDGTARTQMAERILQMLNNDPGEISLAHPGAHGSENSDRARRAGSIRAAPTRRGLNGGIDARETASVSARSDWDKGERARAAAAIVIQLTRLTPKRRRR